MSAKTAAIGHASDHRLGRSTRRLVHDLGDLTSRCESSTITNVAICWLQADAIGCPPERSFPDPFADGAAVTLRGSCIASHGVKESRHFSAAGCNTTTTTARSRSPSSARLPASGVFVDQEPSGSAAEQLEASSRPIVLLPSASTSSFTPARRVPWRILVIVVLSERPCRDCREIVVLLDHFRRPSRGIIPPTPA